MAFAREQYDLLDMLGDLHRANRKLDINVAFDLASSRLVRELFGRPRHHRKTIVIEPIDQGTNGAIFQIFHDRRVVERPKQRSAALEDFEKSFEVDFKAERPRRRIKFGAVDEYGNLASASSHDVPRKQSSLRSGR